MQESDTNVSNGEQRKLAAVMFADMMGYTALMQEDEARARLLRDRHRQVLESLIPSYKGKIIQYFGDGTLSLFESTTNAVRCAIDIQRQLQQEPKVPLRIGIHSGDVVYDKEGIYGDCVNLASRIESASIPGAVLFSGRVHEEIKNQRDIETKFVGNAHFKNVKLPMALYAASNPGLPVPSNAELGGKRSHGLGLFNGKKQRFVLAALSFLFVLVIGALFLLPKKNPDQNSIAVLPLENLSADAAQEYFVSGMHETLISELSKISSLKVISRTSTMQYKKTTKPIREIAKELGVHVLLQGSVLRDKDQVRIMLQLIDGSTDKHLWSKEFNKELQSIFALYTQVATEVAEEIKVKLTSDDQVRLTSTRSVNPRAYELYMLGRHHSYQRTLQGYRQAIDYYKKALQHDSSYALIYAGLADTYMLAAEQGGLSQREARLAADSAIQKALSLDKDLPEAYTSRAVWKLSYEWDWKESEASLKRAIELNPGYAMAYQLYGRTIGFIGRYDEALQHLRKAKELDPLSPVIVAYIGQVNIFAKRYRKAEKELKEGLKLHPNHPLILHNIGELYVAEGRYLEAIEPLKQSAKAAASFHYKALLALAYAKANRRQEAMNVLNELLKSTGTAPSSPFNLAFVYLALGDREEALTRLEQGYREQDVWMKELKAWPWFDELKNEPRYKSLMEKMNFPL